MEKHFSFYSTAVITMSPILSTGFSKIIYVLIFLGKPLGIRDKVFCPKNFHGELSNLKTPLENQNELQVKDADLRLGWFCF